MKALKRAMVAAATIALAAGTAVAIAPGIANAGGVEPDCSPRYGGPVILYWDSWQEGASVCLNGTFSTLAGFTFDNSGLPGSGEPIYNNAASALNWDTNWEVRIWSGTNFTGVFQDLTPCCDEGHALNLGDVANKDKSIDWVSYG